MKKTDIIKEMVEYYQTHDRAVDNEGDCVYFDPITKNQCAVGRCLKNVKNYEGARENVRWLCVYGGKKLNSILKKKYTGHSLDFWECLQDLHDRNRFWEGRELTPKGKARVEELMERYKD